MTENVDAPSPDRQQWDLGSQDSWGRSVNNTVGSSYDYDSPSNSFVGAFEAFDRPSGGPFGSLEERPSEDAVRWQA